MFLAFKILKKLLTLVVLAAVIFPMYLLGLTYYTAHTSLPTASDAIVVLGAAQYNGTPSEVLTDRLKEAKTLYIQGLGKKVITVGANETGDRTTEAASAAQWLIKNGVPKKDIKVIPVGIDTLTSTQAYAAYMHERKLTSVIVATDAYHCLRALTMARDQNVKATCAPTKTGPASLANSGWKYLFREATAYGVYITVGRHGIHITDQIKK
ncbi:MAG: YdcF family protein [Actinomycetes bacterium]